MIVLARIVVRLLAYLAGLVVPSAANPPSNRRAPGGARQIGAGWSASRISGGTRVGVIGQVRSTGAQHMGIQDFIAGQLRKPTGFIGRHVAARFMNWANAEINRRTLEAMSLQPDDRVLEVGPGPGDLMERIVAMVTRGSVTGVDFSPEMIDVCTKRFAPLVEAGRVELFCANANALPCATDQFTKACTVNTIYCWPEPAAVMCELWRVLRTGGRLVVSFRPRVTMKRWSAPPAFGLYDGDQVAGLLGHAGFRDLQLIRGEDRRGEHLCVVGDKWTA